MGSTGLPGGVANLPLYRWTDFHFHVAPGSDPTTITTTAMGSASETIFEIGRLFWVAIGGLVNLATNTSLPNHLFGPLDWLVAQVGSQPILFSLMVCAVTLAAVVGLYRIARGQLGRGLRTAARTFIPFMLILAMVAGAKADASGITTSDGLPASVISNPTVASPGWFADRIDALASWVGQGIPNLFNLAGAGADGPAPNCSSFINQLDASVDTASAANSLDVSVSTLFVASFVQPFEYAQFGTEQDGATAERIGCRYLDYQNNDPTDGARVQDAADAGTGLPTVSANLFDNFGNGDQQTANMTFWATCAWDAQSHKWVAAPGMGASNGGGSNASAIGAFTASSACPIAFAQGLYSAAGQSGGNGKPFEWATSVQTLSDQANSTIGVPDATAFAYAYDGQDAGSGVLLGVGAIVSGATSLWLFGTICFGLLASLLTVMLLLFLAVFLLIGAMSPVDHHHSRVWSMFLKTIIGAVIGVGFFSLIAAVAATAVGVLDSLLLSIIGPASMVTAEVMIGFSPLLVFLALNHIAHHMGIRSLWRPGRALADVSGRIRAVVEPIGDSSGVTGSGWRERVFPDAFHSATSREAAFGDLAHRSPQAATVRDAALKRLERFGIHYAQHEHELGALDGTDGAPPGQVEQSAARRFVERKATEHALPRAHHGVERLARDIGLGPEELAMVAAGHFGNAALERTRGGLRLRRDLSPEHYETLARSLLDEHNRADAAAKGAHHVDPLRPIPMGKPGQRLQDHLHTTPETVAELMNRARRTGSTTEDLARAARAVGGEAYLTAHGQIRPTLPPDAVAAVWRHMNPRVPGPTGTEPDDPASTLAGLDQLGRGEGDSGALPLGSSPSPPLPGAGGAAIPLGPPSPAPGALAELLHKVADDPQGASMAELAGAANLPVEQLTEMTSSAGVAFTGGSEALEDFANQASTSGARPEQIVAALVASGSAPEAAAAFGAIAPGVVDLLAQAQTLGMDHAAIAEALALAGVVGPTLTDAAATASPAQLAVLHLGLMHGYQLAVTAGTLDSLTSGPGREPLHGNSREGESEGWALPAFQPLGEIYGAPALPPHDALPPVGNVEDRSGNHQLDTAGDHDVEIAPATPGATRDDHDASAATATLGTDRIGLSTPAAQPIDVLAQPDLPPPPAPSLLSSGPLEARTGAPVERELRSPWHAELGVLGAAMEALADRIGHVPTAQASAVKGPHGTQTPIERATPPTIGEQLTAMVINQFQAVVRQAGRGLADVAAARAASLPNRPRPNTLSQLKTALDRYRLRRSTRRYSR